MDVRYDESDGPMETRYAGMTPTGRFSAPPRTYDMVGFRVTSWMSPSSEWPTVDGWMIDS